MKGIIVTFLLFAASVKAGVVESKGSADLNSALQEVLTLLPSDYLSKVKNKVIVQEASLKSDSLFNSQDLCNIEEGVKFGETRKNKIFISSRLINLAGRNFQRFPCGHKTFRNHLKAVLIHELTHVKDNKERISLDPDFQRIVGVRKVQGSSKKKVMNQNTSTSPDAYEFRSLEEALAVNTEYFILDPEFECRRPATAAFLSQKMNMPLKQECRKNDKVLVQSAFLEDNYQLAVSIDRKRVYQIHYLFAGKGQALMSRWGHAMFRLVVCAPFRKVAGPECLEDVSHHLALTYRAYMSDMSINYKKGLLGGYPSQLFILRYLEVQQEYTKFELRDLYSLPLKLDPEQKEQFLNLTLERFWTYQGKYFFLNNNCGTETAKHLSVALSEDEAESIGSITPLKIYKDILEDTNNLSAEDFEGLSKEELLKKKVLTPSMYEDYKETYNYLRLYLTSFKEKSFKKFLKRTMARERFVDYENFSLNSKHLDPKERKKVLMKLIHLERYLAARYLMNIPKKAVKLMNKDSDLKEQVMKMGQSLKLLALQPWNVIDSHYGVPTAGELEEQFPDFISKRETEIKMTIEAQMQGLHDILGKSHFQTELEEIEELKKIKTLTSHLIREVNNLK